MNPDDLARILDELGRRIGPTGEYVFELAVRQAVIDGAINVVGGAALLIVGLVLSIAATVRGVRPRAGAGTIAVGLWGGMMLIVGAFAFMYRLGVFLNPEYAALRDILGAIR